MDFRGNIRSRECCCGRSTRTQAMFRTLVVFVMFTIPSTTASCGGLRQGNSGHIRFPTSGTIIGKNTLCEWTVMVPRGFRIELTFVDFVMKTTCCSCVNDYLEIRDGPDANSTLIGDRFCANSQPEVVYSTGNVMWLRFVSNFLTSRGNRFRLSYRSVCGAHFTNLTGTFNSPNYPAEYDNNQNCLYTISVPRGRIKVTFEKFDLQGNMPNCQYDVLEVRETRFTRKKKQNWPSRRYCGSESMPIVYSTKGSYLWFQLKADVSGSGLFFARYRTISVGEGTCGGFLRVSSGLIYSHNYPFQFPANEECIWKIQVPEGKHIHLYFDTLEFSQHGDLDCQYASVTVYDDLEMSSRIGRYCVTTLPGVVISRTNVLTIHAQSSGIHSPGWFSLRYRSSVKGFCRAAEFACKNRQCIKGHLKCDGKAGDCLDSSDEDNCPGKTEPLTWYSFWPLTVVIVVILIGIWLCRTWQRYKVLRSNVESNACICTSSCRHPNPRTSDVIEPPSYDEAVAEQHTLPPSYEEAVQSQQSAQQGAAVADISIVGLGNMETSGNTSTRNSGISDDDSHTLSLQLGNGEPRVEFRAPNNCQGAPYESHRPRSEMAVDKPINLPYK